MCILFILMATLSGDEKDGDRKSKDEHSLIMNVTNSIVMSSVQFVIQKLSVANVLDVMLVAWI